MNRTIEKALAQLTTEEREAIITASTGQKETADKSLLDQALQRVFTLLHDRHEGDLTELTPLEERLLARAVLAGNRLLEIDYYR